MTDLGKRLRERGEEERQAGLANPFQATDDDLPDSILINETSEEFWKRELWRTVTSNEKSNG